MIMLKLKLLHFIWENREFETLLETHPCKKLGEIIA